MKMNRTLQTVQYQRFRSWTDIDFVCNEDTNEIILGNAFFTKWLEYYSAECGDIL